jgi:hypothetical protein
LILLILIIIISIGFAFYCVKKKISKEFKNEEKTEDSHSELIINKTEDTKFDLREIEQLDSP